MSKDPGKHMSMSDPEMAKSGGNFGPKSRDSDLDISLFFEVVPEA